MTRTQNSFFNLVTEVTSSLLVILLNFITRSVFIRCLGEQYLGLEGLFSNILTVLSLAELGFGSAIVFKLYKPIEEHDHPRILVLLKLYRQVYFIIGAVVAVIGLLLIPLLPTLIKDYETVAELGLNATFIFLLYLFNSVSSYWFFAYKTTFVQATQKSYLLNLIGYLLNIASSGLQILALLLTHNFVVYLCIQLLFTILRSLCYAFVCDRRYPFTKEKTSDKISRTELKGFFKDCSALLLYRASNVIIGASDNIVMSVLIGLTPVGLYANYLSLKTSIRTLLYSFTSSIQASLGSLYTTGNLDWSRNIFKVVNLISTWLYGVAGIGIAILTNEFIELWLHSTSLVVTSWTTASGVTINTPVALLIGIEIYLEGQAYYCGSFRNATGLFQELKLRPVFSIIVNLAFSIILVPRIGIAGCVVSTIISKVTTNLIADPIVIFRCALKAPVLPYFFKNILYKLVVAAAGLVCFRLCALVPLSGWVGFILRGCICVIVPSGALSLCFFRTMEFRFLINTLRDMLTKFLRKSDKGVSA